RTTTGRPPPTVRTPRMRGRSTAAISASTTLRRPTCGIRSRCDEAGGGDAAWACPRSRAREAEVALDPVASVALRAVERRIGSLQQAVDVVVQGIEHGDADAHGDGHVTLGHVHRIRRHAAQDAL